MEKIYLINYSVKGIKTLDQLITLSFYKKTIPKNPDTQEYNIKGIYGMNGTGKSAILTSVEILRNLLVDPGYLNNPIAQKNLDAIINKRTEELFIKADYMADLGDILRIFRYSVTLTKNMSGKYIISHESLSMKKATSKSESMDLLFEVIDGEIKFLSGLKEENELSIKILNKTMNLLETASMSVLYYEKIWTVMIEDKRESKLYVGLLEVALFYLIVLGRKIHVYLDQSDDHRRYVARSSIENYGDGEKYKDEIDGLWHSLVKMDNDFLSMIAVTGNIVLKSLYSDFEEEVDQLYEFLHIFKSDLQKIEIDKKEDHNCWICDLVMVYESYRIHAEYESTGIKKLIKLFVYIKEMVEGGIVFIDEFDSNLHDVYLCALLEYLMEYGEGQLCFTTHNVGPMDILKRRKKSIDFLSENHKIYSWKTNGNYSPSKLYRKGMIEGSPFNVDSIDFIGVFGLGREEK